MSLTRAILGYLVFAELVAGDVRAAAFVIVWLVVLLLVRPHPHRMPKDPRVVWQFGRRSWWLPKDRRRR